MGMSWWQIIQIVNRPEGKHPEGEPAKWQTSISQVSHKSCILYTEHIIAASDSMGILHIHCVSKKTGPLLHFQITPTILLQYQQILVQRIVN